MVGFLSRIGKGFKKTGLFFRDGWLELKKVRWPNRQELVGFTLVVLATVTFVTLYFAVIDFGLSETLQFIFRN
jgi:preprotein translocase subunit SecE